MKKAYICRPDERFGIRIYDDWWNAVITDTKPGGGTIDVSSLSSGDYTIDITTSWNNQYDGTFTVP